jgi:hypothetical protein
MATFHLSSREIAASLCGLIGLLGCATANPPAEPYHPRATSAEVIGVRTSHASDDEVCSRNDYEVIAVGEVSRLRLGRTDLLGDCRDNPETDGDVVWTAAETAPMPWQGPGASISLQRDGTLRGLVPGSFSAVAHRGRRTFETTGVVLPVGWTMQLEPQNATIRVGDTQAFRVVVADPAGRALPGVRFSIFPAVTPMILGGPGLVTSTDRVPFRALLAGATSVSGFVGRHVVTTGLVVRSPDDDQGARAP